VTRGEKRSWQKAPPELVARFEGALPRDRSVERRQMFGYPCAFVGGNMFAGLHEHRTVVRLGADETARRIAAGTAAPFEAMGRVMREYVVVPPDAARNPTALATWIREAFGYVASLPPKAPRPRRATAARTRT
jgi:TfoX/Sxy family transcriptional regulator of competence genes